MPHPGKMRKPIFTEKVAEAIAPFKEKTENVEKAQIEMREQVNLLMEQMKSV